MERQSQQRSRQFNILGKNGINLNLRVLPGTGKIITLNNQNDIILD